jgi:hypothetical protein
MTDTKPPPPAWVTDDTIMPPYPVLRCPEERREGVAYAIEVLGPMSDAELIAADIRVGAFPEMSYEKAR